MLRTTRPKPANDDVAEIAEFTEAFLEYVFTMAEKVNTRRSRKQTGKAAKPAAAA